MNNFFNAFLLLLFITSCASGAVSVSSKNYTEKSENLFHFINKKTAAKKVKKYEDMQAKYRAEALNLTTGEKVFYGENDYQYIPIQESILTICEFVPMDATKNRKYGELFYFRVADYPKQNKCVLSRYQDEIYYKDFDSYYEEQKIIAVELEKEKELKKEIILAGLLSRCENFGWKSDDDLASCVQQEAYRDLQLEKQKREIKILEQKLELAQNKSVDDEPLFFMFLDAYAQSKQSDNMFQMKNDITRLKASNAYKGSSTEAALKSLYRTNN